MTSSEKRTTREAAIVRQDYHKTWLSLSPENELTSYMMMTSVGLLWAGTDNIFGWASKKSMIIRNSQQWFEIEKNGENQCKTVRNSQE